MKMGWRYGRSIQDSHTNSMYGMFIWLLILVFCIAVVFCRISALASGKNLTSEDNRVIWKKFMHAIF